MNRKLAHSSICPLVCATALLSHSLAYAQEPPADQPTADTTTSKAPAPSPSPIVPSWSMRGMSAAHFVRVEDSVGIPSVDGQHDIANVTMLGAGVKLSPNVGLSAKWGITRYMPDGASDVTAFSNPVVAASFSTDLHPMVRFATSLGLSAPVGSGGGDDPDPAAAAAQKAGAYTRASMDNIYFAVNETAVPLTGDVAFHYRGFTAQLGLALAPLLRSRGQEVLPDPARFAGTAGLSLGYFIVPQLSFLGELRYQRMLSTPEAVAKDPSLRDNTSFALGARGYVPLTEKVSFRPGVAWGMGVEGKLAELHYQLMQADLPVVF